MNETEKYLDSVIRKIPDFPKPWILFYDITSVLSNPEAFKFCNQKLYERYSTMEIDAIAAVESRGFIFAAPLAEKMGVPLILIRKKGKLPGETYSCSYDLEYGKAEIEVQKNDVKKGQKFLIIDDLIATGGTLDAAKKLLAQAGAETVEFAGIIGLPELNFEKVLAPQKAWTLINYMGK